MNSVSKAISLIAMWAAIASIARLPSAKLSFIFVLVLVGAVAMICVSVLRRVPYGDEEDEDEDD